MYKIYLTFSIDCFAVVRSNRCTGSLNLVGDVILMFLLIQIVL